jgi:N-acyl homoserine lactone hydrolase
MKIHPIQTGSVRIKTKQIVGEGKGYGRLINMLTDPNWTEPLPIYAWLIEHPEGLILVDTGETVRATEPDYFPGWNPFFSQGVRIEMTAEQEIGPQLRALGFEPKDIDTIVLTHLHTDHAGGLHHFPDTRILVHPGELSMARGALGKVVGYLPHRWPIWFEPQTMELSSGPFEAFPASQRLTKAGDVVIVPTYGHTANHISVIAIDGDTSYLMAGDLTYRQDVLRNRQLDGVSRDVAIMLGTMDMVLEYAKSQPTVLLPAHDPQAVTCLESKQTLL